MILVIALVKTLKPTVTTFRYALPPALAGASRTLTSRPSRKVVIRSGASRKSSADLVGGVSTTIRS